MYRRHHDGGGRNHTTGSYAVKTAAFYFAMVDLLSLETPAFARGGHCGDGCQFVGTGIIMVALVLGVVYSGSMAWSYKSLKSKNGVGRRSYYASARLFLIGYSSLDP
jgi:hypothetical protein